MAASRLGTSRALSTRYTSLHEAFAFIVPIFLITMSFGLLDSLLALVLMYLVFNLSFAIWFLKGFIDDLPKEIEESSLVDGCGRLGTLLKVTIPLIAPGIVATTLPPAVSKYLTYMKLDWDIMCALSTLAIAPVVALSLVVRKYLTRRLTLGAVNGLFKDQGNHSHQ